MAIVEPETDINLWINVVSQSLSLPEQLFQYKEQIDRVFSDILEDKNLLTKKYQISAKDFYHSSHNHILAPLLKQFRIEESKEIDSFSLISDILINFLKLSTNFLNEEDETLLEMLLILFKQDNNLYNFNYEFYHKVCETFLYSGFYADFLSYIESILQMPKELNMIQTSQNDEEILNKTAELTKKMKKLPFLSKIEMNLISYLFGDPDFNFTSFCETLMNPLLSFSRFSSDSIANGVFTVVISQLNQPDLFDVEILKLWILIFRDYLESGSFSLVLFSLQGIIKLFENCQFCDQICELLKNDENRDLINLYLGVPIRIEFAEFLKKIYSVFLTNSLMSVDDLSSIWKTLKTSHASVRPSFYSIFEEISKNLPEQEFGKFAKIVLNGIQISKDWLNFIIECATNLSSKSADISEYIEILKKVKDSDFDFLGANSDSLNENDVESYKEIAEKGLSRLLVDSFRLPNFFQFIEEISTKFGQGKETNKDVEVLLQLLTKFSGSEIDFGQFSTRFLSHVISALDRHNFEQMENVIRVLISDPYNCEFNQELISRLLSFTANERICSGIFSFVSELCLTTNKISVDLLLHEMMTGYCPINISFYRVIKSIILNLNNGNEINSFPFVKEDVVWHFCCIDSKQTIRFQHFLSRLYMRSTASDDEMIDSFLTNWINRFKKFYSDSSAKNEVISNFFKFLEIFLKKIEFFIYTPIQYHFSQYKTNKAKFQIEQVNGSDDHSISQTFYFDQRKSVSSLIEYIKMRFNFKSDLKIIYNNASLNKRNSIEYEIGNSNLEELKNSEEPVFISIKEIQQNRRSSNVKELYVRQNRTVFPSRIIVDKIKGLREILFGANTYNSVLYFLPTFNETLSKVRSLTNNDFPKFFPYDNEIEFLYNFESFLDHYSSGEYDLLSSVANKPKASIFENDFVRKSGIIDYFISCGLSMRSEKLVNMILSFLRDYSKYNREILDNEILNEQLYNLISQYVDDKESISESIIKTVFTINLHSMPNLTKDQLYSLFIETKKNDFRQSCRMFLKDIYVPLKYYSYAYDKSQYEPNEIFYSSWGDHIITSPEKDERTIEIIFSNLKKKNAPPPYLECINSAIVRGMFTKRNLETITSYIVDNFIRGQLKNPPKPGLPTAISAASHIDSSDIYESIEEVFDSVSDFNLLNSKLGNFDNDGEYELLDGDSINFRCCDDDNYIIEINCIEHPIGIVNLGATCYINVILQQLFNITDFRFALEEKVRDTDPNDGCFNVLFSLHELFNELEFSNLSAVNPWSFIECFGGIDVNVHNDCCEFFLHLLDRLDISLFNCKFRNVISAIDDESLSAESFEDFTVLPLSIRNLTSIDESFSRLFEYDYFTGDNGYIFEDKKKVDAKKKCEVSELSDHLVIQLERFKYNHETQEREKISSFFQFGDSIILNEEEFQLTGVVVHLGQSAESGHYISYVRKIDTENKSDTKMFSDKWFQYNDRNVSSVSFESVLEDSYENSYLLFYTKSDRNYSINSFSIEKTVEQLNTQSVVCRMVLSNFFFDAMFSMICNVKNPARLRLAVRFFFQFLHQYYSQSLQEKFANKFLSVVTKSSPNDPLIEVILQTWKFSKFHDMLLFCRWKSVREITCRLLIDVIQKVDCFECITSLVVDVCEHLYRMFYSTAEFFEFLDFALKKWPEKMQNILTEKNIDSELRSFFLKICRDRKNIDFAFSELHNFFSILVQIGLNEEIEELLCSEAEVIESFLASNTPVEDTAGLINAMKRKEEMIAKINEIQDDNEKRLALLSQL